MHIRVSHAYAHRGAGEVTHHRRKPVPHERGFVARIAALAVRGVVSLPLAIAAVIMALFGAGRAAARIQVGALRRFGPGCPQRPVDRVGVWAVLGHSAVVLLPALTAFVLTALCLWGIYAGYLYPIRPDASFALGHPFSPDGRFNTSWGGPSLVGAWSIHALVVLGVHVLALPVLRGAERDQGAGHPFVAGILIR